MAVVLWGYLEELILYHLGAYACFDLKTRMPWLQMVGAGVCVLLACVSDIPSSITSYGVMLCVVFFALKEEWKRRFWHVGVLFVLISGMGEIGGTAGNDISVQNKLPCMFQIQNLLYISCSHTGNFAVFYDFFCLWERCSNTL